ncbi:MAG: hypothetical protein U5N55_03560 [Cypionkella sp.]|nr:hypothetical protein [Cypionkella sp.]
MNQQFEAKWPEADARKIVLSLVSECSDLRNLTVPTIIGGGRTADKVQARHWVMYEAFHNGCTQPQIGRVFDLDASTIHHGIEMETNRRAKSAKRHGLPMFRSVRA